MILKKYVILYFDNSFGLQTPWKNYWVFIKILFRISAAGYNFLYFDKFIPTPILRFSNTQLRQFFIKIWRKFWSLIKFFVRRNRCSNERRIENFFYISHRFTRLQRWRYDRNVQYHDGGKCNYAKIVDPFARPHATNYTNRRKSERVCNFIARHSYVSRSGSLGYRLRSFLPKKRRLET